MPRYAQGRVLYASPHWSSACSLVCLVSPTTVSSGTLEAKSDMRGACSLARGHATMCYLSADWLSTAAITAHAHLQMDCTVCRLAAPAPVHSPFCQMAWCCIACTQISVALGPRQPELRPADGSLGLIRFPGSSRKFIAYCGGCIDLLLFLVSETRQRTTGLK